MSTIEDFENAPVGATASSAETNARYVKNSDDRWLLFDGRGYLLVEKYHLQYESFKLDPAAPTTAREARDLAWELAHPVKEGQKGEIGTELIARFKDGDFKTYRAEKPFDGESVQRWAEVRSLDPLPEPDPEPDWLDAPAVVAWNRWDDVRREKVWSKADECYKSTDGEIIDWSELRDVTPLYPREQDA